MWFQRNLFSSEGWEVWRTALLWSSFFNRLDSEAIQSNPKAILPHNPDHSLERLHNQRKTLWSMVSDHHAVSLYCSLLPLQTVQDCTLVVGTVVSCLARGVRESHKPGESRSLTENDNINEPTHIPHAKSSPLQPFSCFERTSFLSLLLLLLLLLEQRRDHN